MSKTLEERIKELEADMSAVLAKHGAKIDAYCPCYGHPAIEFGCEGEITIELDSDNEITFRPADSKEL